VEVGVYRGGTAWHLAKVAREKGVPLHLFDTFTGIPEQGPEDHQHRVGDFSTTSYEMVKKAIPDAIFHVGFFPNTMPQDGTIKEVGFVHVDCDQYASVIACIEVFWPRLMKDGIMVFDDYDCTSGCRKAVDEWTEGRVHLSEYGKAYVIK
jgi:O-methyltransferase